MMKQRNLFTALLLILVATLVSSLTSRETQSMNYEGAYTLRSAMKDSVVQVIPSGRTITMKLEQQPDTPSIYRVNIKVANILMTSLEIISSENGKETIRGGPVASTRMMPPPELQPLEFFISDYFPQMNSMELTEEVLVMEGGGAKLEWQQAGSEEDAE